MPGMLGSIAAIASCPAWGAAADAFVPPVAAGMVIPPIAGGAGVGCCPGAAVGALASMLGMASAAGIGIDIRIGTSACTGVEGAGVTVAGTECLAGARRAGVCFAVGAGFATGLGTGFGRGIGMCMPGSMVCAAAEKGSDAATATVASNK